MAFSTAGMRTRRRSGSFGVHDHVGEAERVGGAAHVLLHQQHAGGRLDVEAAGIEADALADDRDLGIAVACPRPARSGAARAPASRRRRRRGSSGKFFGDEPLADDLRDDGAVAAAEVAGGVGELGRAEVVGAGVDEVAGERDGVGDAGDLVAIDAGRQDELRGPAACRRGSG